MGGEVIEVLDEDDDLQAHVLTPGLTVLDFTADWCPPCRRFAPVFDASAGRHPDVRHVRVDVDYRPDLAADFDVRGIPTTVVLRDGVMVRSVSGALDRHGLDELIDSARAGEVSA
ncbi:MAG: thioredoxin family protein [Candidatus Nanopelagicales bacterium]